MYELQAFHDALFVASYGGVTVFYVLVCLYLLFRRGNAFSMTVQPPRELRYWAAGVVGTFALSNLWWVVLGCTFDDLVLGNALGQALDILFMGFTLLPLLIRMLQDRRRPLWPVALMVAPGVLIAVVVGIVMRDASFTWLISIYVTLLFLFFFSYMAYALRQYGHWLRANFSDLRNKELGKNLVLIVGVQLFYIVYLFNMGALWIEYLSMLISVILVIIVLWRVESLQSLVADGTLAADDVDGQLATARTAMSPSTLTGIGSLLEECCESRQLYLHSDLTLDQLCRAIGTNRTYLSQYLADQGTTYNAYINRLRVEHFVRLYREAISQPQLGSVSAQQLAYDSGFRSYRTFSNAFKRFMGQAVNTWVRNPW
ncbi:MAG: helix-turn-helix domain-containing protein [Prevotella sp.]|nr:helix-turn-helix domain-containing protein [Prevotella sp.]